MPISKNRCSGYPVALTVEFLYQQVFLHATTTGKSEHDHTILQGQRDHCQNEIWGQNPLPWNSLALPLHAMILRTSTRMCINSGDYLEEANVRREWKSTYINKSWSPSRNASSLSGHLHCWRQRRDGSQLMLLGLTPMQSLLP